MELSISLPIKAISSNTAYPTGKQGRRYLCAEGKEFKTQVGFTALQICRKKNWKCSKSKFEVIINFFFKDKRRRDIDDYFKLVIDSLTEIIWEDDSQIIALAGTKSQGVEDAILINIKTI